MRLARALAVLLLGCAVCMTVRAQAPAETEPAEAEPAEAEVAQPSTPEARRERRQRERGTRAPRAFTVTWDAPEPLRKLFQQHLGEPKPEEAGRRGSTLRPWIREVRRRVPEIAAAEGYFSATLDVDFTDE